MANIIIKNGKSVVRAAMAIGVVTGMVLTGTACVSDKLNDIIPGHKPSDKPNTEVVVPSITSTECLYGIDNFVSKHFKLGKCQVQSIASQREDNGSLSISKHDNYRDQGSFEGVDLVIQVKIVDMDKSFVFVIPVPTNIYLSSKYAGLLDDSYNLNLSRADIEEMEPSKLKAIENLIENISLFYNGSSLEMDR